MNLAAAVITFCLTECPKAKFGYYVLKAKKSKANTQTMALKLENIPNLF